MNRKAHSIDVRRNRLNRGRAPPIHKKTRGAKAPPTLSPGVHIYDHNPTIAFLTICTAKRRKGLAKTKVHKALVKTWTAANEWLVGHYVIMPNHIHMFCAPQIQDFSIEQWITSWKQEFRQQCKTAPWFQPRGVHHRLRRDESYSEKLDYMLNNPVRAGLVKTPEEWKFQGVLRILPWWRA